MHIAICDDDMDELLHISSILDKYRQKNNVPVSYRIFQSALDLLSNAQEDNFSLYLLDIMMPGANGIETAREIRAFDEDTPIIFLTSSTEFAYQSYSVKAQDYLIKPASAQKLYPILNHFFDEMQKAQEYISLKTKSGMVRIFFSQLAFVEVANKRVLFHLSDGKVREVIAPLVEYESILLARPEFMRVHRSYVVNFWHMADLSQTGLKTIAGDEIPISRRLYSTIKEIYVVQSFNKEGK